MFVVAVIAAAGWFAWFRWEAPIATTPAPHVERRLQNVEPQTDSVMPVASENESEPTAVIPDRSASIIQHSVLLPVPFVSQAPFRVWSLPYKEYCEEASVLTLHYWKSGRATPAADVLDLELKEVQAWEEANLGRWEDTTAEETARVLREHFGYSNTKVVRDITPADITRELNAGRPVIVPARSRELDSPYFTPPGPLYHMLVIIGYDDAVGQWIANDVGTNTKGAGQRYAYDDVFDAIGDWSHDIGGPNNQKVMIVVEN
jgi:hypothetical protein